MIGDVCGINPFSPVCEIVCGKETCYFCQVLSVPY